MSARPRWGLSPLDRHQHAVDESRDHPRGALQAECGRLLVMTTRLSDEPSGRTCGACAEIQADRALTRRTPHQPDDAR